MALLTPADVRRLLATHAVAPRKAHGQNFVVDPNTVRKVVRDAGVEAADLVCEVGPGLGSLTLALREAGAHVVAVEIDAGLVRALHEVLGDDDAVAVIHADAMGVSFPALLDDARARWSLPDAPAALVANLPYNLATPILMTALDSGAFARSLVMVQKEVGQRWAAGVGHPLYGAVSVKIAASARARIAAQVSRHAFYPVPNVDSVTVRVDALPWRFDVSRTHLFALVERGFAQRRKRLRNALAAPGLPPVAIEEGLRRAGLDVGARAEELDVDRWAALAAALPETDGVAADGEPLE